MNDQTKKIFIILLITFHHCTIEKLKAKIVTWRYWYWNWFCLGQRSRGINKTFNYSFKIFLRFWLAKITRIIHQNKLLLTTFGRVLPYWTDDVKSEAKLQIIKPLNQENLGRVWVNGRTFFTRTIICMFWTDFTSSVWNFCRWVADVPPRETSPSGEERGKTCVFAGSLIQ